MSSTKNDVVIYDVEFFSGIIEVIETFAEDVNTNTRGAVNYVTQKLKGDFEKRSFWSLNSDIIQDRDPTDLSDVTPEGLSQGELVAPKQNLRAGPFEATLDQFKKLGDSPEVMSFILGTQLGEEIAVEWLDRAMTATAACLTKSAATHLDISGETDNTITPKALNRALGKMGDRRNRVVAWVMHSGAFTDLTENQITDKLPGNTDVIIYGGSTATMGLPVLISDVDSLITVDSGTGDVTYTVLGLTADAVRMIESEDREVEVQKVLGKANITRMWQAEMALNIRVKGFSYNGSASPSKAAIGTGANWDYVFSSIKSGPGVALTVAGI